MTKERIKEKMLKITWLIAKTLFLCVCMEPLSVPYVGGVVFIKQMVN